VAYSCHDREVTDLADGRLRVSATATAAAPASARERRVEATASVWVRGAFAAAWSAALGIGLLIVVALILWTTDSRSGANAGDAMRLAGQLWLIANRTPLQITGGGALTIPPLALTIGLGLVVARATAIVARASRCTEARDLGVVIASVVAPYAVIATVLAALVPSSTLRPSIGAAFVCAVIVGGTFATLGASRGAALPQGLMSTVSERFRLPVRAAGTGALVLMGAASLLAVGSVLAHVHRFAAIMNGYTGAPGELSMLFLSLTLMPNAVVFTAAYLVGPGFAVGAGSSVAAGGAHVGAVPALPLVAAVPSGAAPLPVLIYCVVAVLATGAVIGWRLRRAGGRTLVDRLRSVAVAGAIFGTGFAVLAGLAGGPGGPGRLRAVGPSPWQVGFAAGLEVTAVAAAVVLVVAFTDRRHRAGRLVIDLTAAATESG
jgi:hypothetical protein